MKQITKLDKILLILGFLIVLGIFTLAFIIAFKGGQCAINPLAYAQAHNISIFSP